MNLTKNFTRRELQCPCGCTKCDMEPDLLVALQRIRDNMKRPLIITSGFRCAEKNRQVGGSLQSQHLRGRAVDINIKDWANSDVYRLLMFALREQKINGFGFHEDFLHIDCRTQRASWVY